MINMRMAQDHSVYSFRVKRKLTVPFDGFATAALEESALKQQTLAVEFNEIHRAGGRSRGAKEVDAHGGRKTKAILKVERD